VMDPVQVAQRLAVFRSPFAVGRDGTREECVQKYRAWLYELVRSDYPTLVMLAQLDRRVPGGGYFMPVLRKAALWASNEVTTNERLLESVTADEERRVQALANGVLGEPPPAEVVPVGAVEQVSA
jgi:hypothetical protein